VVCARERGIVETDDWGFSQYILRQADNRARLISYEETSRRVASWSPQKSSRRITEDSDQRPESSFVLRIQSVCVG
ncbi:MAG: hypothetical protein ABGZ17_25695, partial [Planctomycetaceae bacterium]